MKQTEQKSRTKEAETRLNPSAEQEFLTERRDEGQVESGRDGRRPYHTHQNGPKSLIGRKLHLEKSTEYEKNRSAHEAQSNQDQTLIALGRKREELYKIVLEIKAHHGTHSGHCEIEEGR
jgi:hypothetical protein